MYCLYYVFNLKKELNKKKLNLNSSELLIVYLTLKEIGRIEDDIYSKLDTGKKLTTQDIVNLKYILKRNKDIYNDFINIVKI